MSGSINKCKELGWKALWKHRVARKDHSLLMYSHLNYCFIGAGLKVELLRKTEKAMIKATCRMKLIDRKSIKKLMQMSGVTVLMETMVRAAAVRWYGYILQTEESNILKKVLNFEVTGRK